MAKKFVKWSIRLMGWLAYSINAFRNAMFEAQGKWWRANPLIGQKEVTHCDTERLWIVMTVRIGHSVKVLLKGWIKGKKYRHCNLLWIYRQTFMFIQMCENSLQEILSLAWCLWMDQCEPLPTDTMVNINDEHCHKMSHVKHVMLTHHRIIIENKGLGTKCLYNHKCWWVLCH